MKLLYIILDGLGDKPIKQLKKKTPLEAAYKPNMDALSAKSQIGTWFIEKNFAPESDVATLALFGYDPFEVYTGRGPLEAFGAGIKLKKNEIAIRCNFALEKNGKITDVEARISEEYAKKLAERINSRIKKIGDVKIKFIQTVGYRAILILQGKNLSPKISNTNPSYAIYRKYASQALPIRQGVPAKMCVPLNNTKEAQRTAAIVNEFLSKSRELLMAEERANIILARGAGNNNPKLEKLPKKWIALLNMPTEIAIAKLAGMKVIESSNDFAELAKQAKQALKKANAVYIHIKKTDTFSHQGDYICKKETIEDFDNKFLGNLRNLKNVAICITGDHSTPCELRAHSADPVPIMLYVPDEDGDCLRFGERFAVKGSLGTLRGTRLFTILEKLLLFN